MPGISLIYEEIMLVRKKLNVPGLQILAGCAFGGMFLLAIVLRISLYHIQTSDYTVFLSQWYDFIQTHGGFAALKYNFSNYNTPYLYLLTIATYLPIPKLIAIKTLSVIFDGVPGLFAYLILSLKYRHSYAAIVGVIVILFAPTIVINSAAWGQSDSIYTALCLGSLYFLLKERPAWTCIFFGLAISIKLQAIFFLPVLLMLLLKRKLPIKYLALIPAVFLLLLAPAFIAGRNAWSLLTIYIGQINSGGVGGTVQFNGGTGRFNGGGPGPLNGGGIGPSGGGFPGSFSGGGHGGGSFSSSSLTLNAPSFYQWLPANAPEYWKWIGILLAAMVIVLVGILLLKSKKQLTTDILLKVTLVFALAIPFLLPEMHERYFYLADVVSILYAFYNPRFFYIAVIMQLCSLLSYAPYFLNTQVVNLAYVAFAVLVITIITLVDLVRTLYPDIRKRVQA
ncbi:MAG: glycosyltransferase 87 family protein [Ktedonobacteraceae bacterium]